MSYAARSYGRRDVSVSAYVRKKAEVIKGTNRILSKRRRGSWWIFGGGLGLAFTLADLSGSLLEFI